MNWYIYIEDGKVCESIPEFNPDLPGFPIEDRYPADFLAKCVIWPEPVPYGWLYDAETNTFSAPPVNPPDPPTPDSVIQKMQEEIALLRDAVAGQSMASAVLQDRVTTTQEAVTEAYELIIAGGE